MKHFHLLMDKRFRHVVLMSVSLTLLQQVTVCSLLVPLKKNTDFIIYTNYTYGHG